MANHKDTLVKKEFQKRYNECSLFGLENEKFVLEMTDIKKWLSVIKKLKNIKVLFHQISHF